MSIEKINVGEEIARIKAKGGKIGEIDTVEEKIMFSLFALDVELHPEKYNVTEKDKKEIQNLKTDILLQENLEAAKNNTNTQEKILDTLDKLM